MRSGHAAIRNGFRSADVVTPYFLTPTSIQSGNTLEDGFVANVSPTLFDMTGVRPAVGRTFNAADTTRAALPSR